MLKARNPNNPILRPIGRSVGWNAQRKSACQRHATTRLINSSVFSTRHRCATSAVTPHCAPLRYAYVGLLRYRAYGTQTEEIPLAHCVRGGMVRAAGPGDGGKDGRRRYVHFFLLPEQKKLARVIKIICTFAARKVSSAFRKVVGKCRWVRGRPLVSGKTFLRNSLSVPPCCGGEE